MIYVVAHFSIVIASPVSLGQKLVTIHTIIVAVLVHLGIRIIGKESLNWEIAEKTIKMIAVKKIAKKNATAVVHQGYMKNLKDYWVELLL
jgi:hypothetical protein